MTSKWEHGAWRMVLSCWILLFAALAQAESAEQLQALPASAVQVAPASAVQAVPTPAEDYEAGVKAHSSNDSMGALTLFKRAADAGHMQAQARYADFLKRGRLIPEALIYFRMSVQANKDGQYGLGTMYEAGDGVKQDFGVARFLYGLAAEQGQRDAAFKMAEAYIKGQPGLDETERQGPVALSWIRRAAGHNYLPAMDALAAAYREGKFGITADPAQAAAIVAVTNKLRGVVVKEKKKSALFKLLKGDSEKKADNPE